MPASNPTIVYAKTLCDESRALREECKIIRQQCKHALVHSRRIHARILERAKSK
jgi:hypothetical protein